MRIEPQPWMTARATRRVLSALGQARFVGGCVRDAALARKVTDIDIATPLVPEEAMRRLEAAGIKVVPTGLKHGTITAVADHRPYEITTLRHDVETDGRHATVAFTDDWQADAARRDFTMNAMFADADGTVFDFFGGLADARAGRVRFVGDAARRIAEDYLRILRFYRFVAHYGAGAPDEVARAACREGAPGMARLSAERVRTELLKLLKAPAPVPTLVWMREDGILPRVLPEAGEFARLDRLAALEAAHGLADPIRRLAALTGPGVDAPALAERLRLSNRERDRLSAMLAPGPAFEPRAGAAAWRREFYRRGTETVVDRALLACAEAGGQAPAELLAAAADWKRPQFALRGEDAMALGLSGGAIGEALRAVEAAWIAGDFAEGRAALLARLKAWRSPA